jgi:hypothetical protein
MIISITINTKNKVILNSIIGQMKLNPILLRHEDVFGSRKLERTSWLTNVEIYKTIGDTVQESTWIMRKTDSQC